MIVALLTALACAAPAAAPVGPAAELPDVRWSWVGLPIMSLNVDEGVGGGLVAAIYRFRGARLVDDISFRGSITNRLVQRYELRWQGHDVLELPLRLAARAGFFSTLTRTYCGTGNGVTCDPTVAEAAAVDAGLTPGGTAFDDFVRHFYLVRFMRPFIDAVARWRVTDQPTSGDAIVEVFAGPRLAWTIPGDLRTRLPYPGSLFVRTHPDAEAGPSAVLQLGVTVDTRDFEPSPSRGYFFESSVRGSVLSPSGRQHVGANASLTGYVQLDRAGRLPLPSPIVLAQRLMVDVVTGDVPVEELAVTGGVYGHAAFGGQWIGRGVRDHRYLGELRVIEQVELRSELVHVDVFDRHLDACVGVFGDAAWIGADANDLDGRIAGVDEHPGSPWRILFGVGVGLRVLIDRAILLRIDVAASPFEEASPAFYTPVGHPL